MSAARQPFVHLGNAMALPLAELPPLSLDEFSASLVDAVKGGARVSAFFGAPGGHEGSTALYAILADDAASGLLAARSEVKGSSFPSLTPQCPELHLFEREIAEEFGIRPEGHPWFKPVRYHHSWTGRDAWGRDPSEPILPAVGDFYRVEGEEVHEVAVGPVHAGVIEPGHFRFQCNGEKVFHLEIALGYQHRGIEKAMEGGPTRRSLHYMETVAGDTTIGHATSYCHVIEALASYKTSVHSHIVRGLALELERLANHVGDLGALAGDVGYLPTSSFCGRIRGDFLNMTALLCGNRFGRGLVLPGGLGYSLEPTRAADLLSRLEKAEADTTGAVNLLWDEGSVMARFEETGAISSGKAAELGIVGPAARATGLSRDVRYNHPSGIFRFVQIPVSTCDSGDVFARAYVRWLEIQQSLTFLKEQLRSLPPPTDAPRIGEPAPESLAVSLNEGWRGEVCHVGLTDPSGRLSRYKVVDPSFHNWFALAYALRGQEISDFPLCNKSFNLSYCGHDL
jgi:Ni,Fe-hydrogenase III large subunit